MVQIRTKWCDSLVEHRGRTRSGNGRPTPSLGQADRHGHKAGSSTRTRTLPGGRGISSSAQLPHTAEGGPVSAPANHATRLRGLGRPQRRRTVLRGAAPQRVRLSVRVQPRGPWAGAGPHWGRQRAIGVGKLPTPIVGFLPRCESPAPIRLGALGRAPPPGTGARGARRGRVPRAR